MKFRFFSVFSRLYKILVDTLHLYVLQNFPPRNIAISVAEPHHYAAPAPGKNFDAATDPAPNLLNCLLFSFPI
jgi:hypothetical protein